MKPLIGITTSEYPGKYEWSPEVYGQNFQYSDAILAAGGIPVLLPFTHDSSQLRDVYERLDGIMFAGGGDISPTEYGEALVGDAGDIIPERDRIELQLIKWAIADNKPVLAICRGFQIMNVALGGTLYQDIPTMVQRAEDHQASVTHEDRHYIAHQLTIDGDSKLARILGVTTIGANSMHHQAIKKPAPGLTVTGYAEDGIIESVELASSRFAIGVQCHPEGLRADGSRWNDLFLAFVRESGSSYASDDFRKSSNIDVVAEAA